MKVKTHKAQLATMKDREGHNERRHMLTKSRVNHDSLWVSFGPHLFMFCVGGEGFKASALEGIDHDLFKRLFLACQKAANRTLNAGGTHGMALQAIEALAKDAASEEDFLAGVEDGRLGVRIREVVSVKPEVQKVGIKILQNDAPAALPDKLAALLLMAVKNTGTYDPARSLTLVEEQLTGDECEVAEGFLKWVHINNRTFGSGNIQEVYEEFTASVAV